MRAKTGSEKVSREKSEIQELSTELKTFLNHGGLPRSSKSKYPVDFRGFDLSWKPRSERSLYHKTKPYTARISHNLYGSRQWNILLNEGGKLLESFVDFLSARRQRFAGQTVTFIRTNTRKNGGGFSASEGPWERKVFSTIHSLGSRVKFLSPGSLDGSWREHSMRSS